VRPAALLLTIPLLLTGCSSTAEDDGRVHVVTSTNVYGSIVESVGGDRVDVTSIVSDPSRDPHSVEPSARVQLALARADVVVENGGGYDDYVDTLLAGTTNTGATVINATAVSGYDTSGTFNEHVFYDVPTMIAVVHKVEMGLAAHDPGSATVFDNNATTLIARLRALQSRIDAVASTWRGTGVAITEPVPLYLLNALGLENLTPPEFSEAIEDERDVPPLTLQQTLALFADGKVRVLVYNEQTESAQTEHVKAAAIAAGVPVVGVTETLSNANGEYVQWLTAEVDAIEEALAS
jgi:zinc/manganese transport system substrate-binding protein